MRRIGPLSRALPTTAALGIVTRLAAWPLFFVGARALAPARFVTVGLLFAVAFTGLGLPKTRRAAIVSAILLTVPAFGAARAAAAAMGMPAPAILAVVIALGAAGALFNAVRAHLGTTLDVRALALAPVGLWISFSALQARFGAEAVHLHELVPTLTTALSVTGAVLAAVGVVATRSLRSWVRTVRPAPIPADEAPPPKLSDVEPCDAALVATDGEGPYRSPSRGAFALVPASLDVLVKRYGEHIAIATAVLAVVTMTAGLLASEGPRVAHAAARDEAHLPTLPGRCAASPPKVVFVPTEGLSMVDIEVLASRYRRVAGIPARVGPPLRLDPVGYDGRRAQWAGEGIAAHALRDALPAASDELVVVVTDRDMYLREENWRYAFALRRAGVAVVAVSRMSADFPWSKRPDVPYAPSRPACTQMLDERMHKMITRSILLSRCVDAPQPNPESVLRPSIMSVADLDAVDERTF